MADSQKYKPRNKQRGGERDYYRLLNVSPHASQREIRNAFRNLIKESHPDLQGVHGASHERLRRLINAYHTLSNPNLRREYNLSQAIATSARPPFNFRNFLLRRTSDWHSQARLIFYDLLHDNSQSALTLYKRYFNQQRDLKKYMSRDDYMDCAFLLAEAYESQGDYRPSWRLLIDIANLELAKPYFKHFFVEIQEGLQRLLHKRLKKRDNPHLLHQDLRVLLRLNLFRRGSKHWKSLITRFERYTSAPPRAAWLLMLMLSLFVAFPLPSQVLDSPAAIVRLHETVNISRNELQRSARLVERQLGSSLTLEQRRSLLDAEISSELIRQDAESQNIRVTDSEIEASINRQRQSLAPNATESQFRSVLEQQTGISWQAYRDQIKRRLMQEKYIFRVKQDKFAAIRPPIRSEIEKFYDENATRFTNPAIVQIEFLLVDIQNISDGDRSKRRALAQRLYRQATASVSAFEKARRDALDDANYSARQLLILRDNRPQQQRFGESFIEAVFAIGDNQFAPRLLESKVGFHVVRVVERRAPKVLQLDDPVLPGQNITVADQISNLLLSQTQQEVFTDAIKEITEDLRRRADVRIFDQALEW